MDELILARHGLAGSNRDGIAGPFERAGRVNLTT